MNSSSLLTMYYKCTKLSALVEGKNVIKSGMASQNIVLYDGRCSCWKLKGTARTVIGNGYNGFRRNIEMKTVGLYICLKGLK